jgi:hypothetical protein
MPPTICCSHSASVSSKAASLRLSMSKTPATSLSIKTGTTISERDSLLQAMCPGNSSTSGTIIVFLSFQAVPQTPLPKLILSQAGGPTFGPNISHCPFPSDSSSFPMPSSSLIPTSTIRSESFPFKNYGPMCLCI